MTVTMDQNQLDIEAQQLAHSSAYRYGDKTSFQVPLNHGVKLPGSCDPAAFFGELKLPPGAVTMVMCCGNGGLAAQLHHMGAKEVIAVEPRNRFHRGLTAALVLLAKARPGSATKVVPVWPHLPEHQKLLPQVDLIVWSEGADECPAPVATIQNLWNCLKPGGQFLIELIHGNIQKPGGRGSWKPTPTSWSEVLTQIGCTNSVSTDGRTQTSKRYLCTKPGAVQPAPTTAQSTPAPVTSPTPTPPPSGVRLAAEPDDSKGKRKKG